MKLLDKTSLQQQQSLERKKEIDEGVKLAGKVDSLRELASREQANLIKFRDESVARIKEEISRYTSDKTSLLKEIEDLKEKRKELEKPLDEEWKRVSQREGELNVVKEIIYLKETDLNQKEQALISLEKTLKAREVTTAVQEEKVSTLVNIATNNHKESEVILKRSKVLEEKVIKRLQKQEQQTNTREAIVAVKERELEMKFEHIKTQQKEIDEEKVRLADQRATLDRAFNRIKRKL